MTTIDTLQNLKLWTACSAAPPNGMIKSAAELLRKSILRWKRYENWGGRWGPFSIPPLREIPVERAAMFLKADHFTSSDNSSDFTLLGSLAFEDLF